MIYKLQRESTAVQIIKRLPRLWSNINHLVLQLQKTTITYSTTELLSFRNNFVVLYNAMNTFNTDYGVWFASRYPEFADGLTGAITSLQNINSVIMTGLQNNYWDSELDVPVITNISQTHRDALATAILAELEA